MTDTAHDQDTFPFGFTDDSDRTVQRRVPTLPAPPRTEPGPAAARTPDDAIFRSSATTPAAAVAPTAVLEVPAEPTEEERKLAAERAARREAREAALAAPDVRTAPAPEPVVVTRRSTDRFPGAFGLFLVRLVVAAIMAVHGLAFVTDPIAAQQLFATTIIPEPGIMATVTGFASLAIAVALVFGLLTRVAGLGVLLIAGGALTFVLWGNWSPFIAGRAGFVGELELLLAVAGLLLLCIGGGGFSLDRSFRKSRENRTS
ncbi:MAG: DoxX family protein [Micropruina sp.]